MKNLRVKLEILCQNILLVNVINQKEEKVECGQNQRDTGIVVAKLVNMFTGTRLDATHGEDQHETLAPVQAQTR